MVGYLFQADLVLAQATKFGAGGYLSWWKLALIAFTFFVWVKLCDWISQDSVRIEEETKIKPEVWNPISVVAGLIGFLLAISIPIFWIGYPLFLLSAIIPFVAYRISRAGQLKDNQSLKARLNPKKAQQQTSEALTQDEGVEMTFSPAGDSDTDRKAALVKARTSGGFVDMKQLLHEGKFKRADTIELNYTQSQMAARLFVDGTWHGMPNMDRPRGDALLVSLKSLAGLDPQNRRSKQAGSFSVKSELGKAEIRLRSKGSSTGEKVRITYMRETKDILNLKQLGMFPSMADRFIASLNLPGLSIVSAPPKHGLTSTWQGLLVSADRLTRDCVGFFSEDETETSVENIAPKVYDSPEEAPAVLKALLLAQPDSIAVPNLTDSETMDTLTEQANTQDRAVWTKIKAASAAEALLKMYSIAKNRGEFRSAIKYVSNQRLIRRLCDSCKEEQPVPPKTIQQLGGDPRKQQSIYRAWRLPPPEQRVDEQGNPIEFPPCPTCGGIGYIGRIAVFEMIKVNDAVRETLKKTPTMEAIEKAAKESKAKKSMKSAAFQLVLLGVTSIEEAQSALKSPTKK